MKSPSSIVKLCLALLLCLGTVIPMSAQQIISIEYFFDTDPGFGNGISIPVVPDSSIQNLTVTIDYSSVGGGFHTLYIRSQDSAGSWSLTNRSRFFKSAFPVNRTQPTITAIEYFFDTDPGFGNGISLPLSSDTAIHNLLGTISLIGLASGNHTLYIRTKDSMGSWSLTNKQVINYCSTGTNFYYPDFDHDGFGTLSDSVLACTMPVGYTSNHTDCDDNDSTSHQQYPFYIDNDGDNYGNGILTMVCAQNDTTPPLGYGLHFGDCNDNDATSHQEFPFYIDNDGDLRGTGTTTYLFCAPAANLPPPGYATTNTDCDDNNPDGHFFIPFYIDVDGDGFGASTNTVLLCSNLSEVNYPPVGYTYFSYGVDCNDNDWDLRMTFPFYVDADQDGYGIGNLVQVCALDSGAPPVGYSLQDGDCNDNDANMYPGKIDQMEYYLDSDPGVGQGIALNITGLNIDSLSSTFPIIIPTNLQPGFHIVAIRAHTCGLHWGLFEQRSFNVTAQDIYTGPLVTGEYFIDTDPGLGNGISFSISISDTLNQQVSIAVPPTTPPGNHPIGIRFKDSLGNWSHFETTFIVVYPPPVPTYSIMAAEYFIDTDPGIGNAIPLSIIPSDTLLQTFAITVPTNLQDGHHLISIRVKNSINEWSLFDNRTFYVSNFDSVYNPIVAAEYFIDTDPGIGNATAISVVPSDTILQNFAITVSNTLAFGNHSMNVRVMTLDSVWSLHESKIFNIKEPPTMLPGSGNAITLDGVNDYIQLPPILHGDQQFTIDFWIKTTESGSSGTYWQKPTIIGNANPSAPDGDFGITTHNGQLGVWSGMCCGDQALQTTMSINDNQWHHIAAVNNGSILVLYVDGVLLPGSIPTNNGGIENITRPWRIGMNNSCCSGGSPHAGTVDEFRFWNTALSETQLRERMCRKITDSDSLYSNMSAYFNFDEQGLLNAIDGSSNSNSPTLQNGASRILSGAPIGNVSAYAYSGNTSSVGLSHPTRGDQITANITSGSANGLQVYCVTERPNTLTGIDTLLSNDAYYGVFAVNGNLAQVNTMYNYTGVPNITNEGLLNLYQRNANDSLSWTNSSASLNTINNTLSTSTLYRNEFMLGIIQPTYITFNLKAYLEGYYLGNGVMASVLFNQGEPNLISQTDTVDIILHNSISPYAIEYSTKGVLDTDGNASFILPASVQGNSYYITLKHRNSFETWSANPITMSAITNYNFTTSASQAYGDNLVEVDPGIFAIYCGDINQDQNADLLDASLLETSIANFDFGYFATDINGDGNVDLLDSPMLEVNMNGFIFSNYP